MSGIAGRVFRLLDDMKANLLARTGHLYIAHKEDGEALWVNDRAARTISRYLPPPVTH